MPDLDLDSLLAEHGSWADVVTALTATASEGGDGQAHALRCLVEVERLHRTDLEAAAEALESLIEVDADNLDLLGELATLYREAEDFESEAAVLLDHAAAMPEGEARGEVLRAAVRVYADDLKNTEGADLVLQKALSESPLEQANWQLGAELGSDPTRATALIEVLTGHVNLVTDQFGEDSLVPLLVIVADLYRTGGSLDLADAFLTRASLIDEEDESVMAALAAVQRDGEDWESLAETLTKHAGHTLDQGTEVELRRELGKLQFEQLGKTEGAIEQYSKAFELGRNPDDAATLHALYDATGRTQELVGLLRTQASAADESERVGIYLQIAAVHSGTLQDSAGAIAAYREVLEVDPANDEAARGLADAFEAAEEWSALADHLYHWAERSDGDGMVATLIRRAVLQETHLADAGAAVVTFETVRDLDDSAEGVLDALVRLYSASERWSEAITCHMRLAELATSTDGWAAHLVDAAGLYRNTGGLEEAAATYSLVLQHVTDHAGALASLEELQTEAGDVEGAIQSLKQRVGLETDPIAVEELRLRLAQLEVGVRPADAVETARAAVDANPENGAARKLLGAALEGAERWSDFADWLTAECEREFDLGARAALLARVGEVLQYHLDNIQGAHESYRQAIELDPSNLVAATPLAQSYLESEDWVRARPLLETLSEAGERGSEEWLTATLNLAATYEFLDLGDRAIGVYEATLEFAPDRVATLSALGRLQSVSGNPAKAEEAYARLLGFIDALAEADRVDVLHRAGNAAAAAGLGDLAVERFRGALAIDEVHEPSLKALAALETEDADPQARLEAKETLLQITEEPAARLKLLLEIGDAYRDLEASAGAVEAYTAALELEKDSKVVLHKLLSVYTETELWEPAAQTLMRLARMESSEPMKVKLLFTIGAIYRDQLSDPERAGNVFDNLLDEDPARVEAFAALESLHLDRQDWTSLQKAYRRQLGRILDKPGFDDMHFNVAKKLGAVYRDALDQPDDAVAAFQVAAGMRPDDAEVLEAIAAIYPKAGKSDDMLIEQHRALVGLLPEREDSYHLLFGAYERERRFDEAWTATSILAVLGNREKKPTDFYHEHRPQSVPLVRRGLTRPEWRMLQHPDLSVEATRLLSVIGATLRRVYSHDLKDWGVHRRKDAIDITAPSPVVNLFHYSAQVLGVAMPPLYSWSSGAGFQNGNTEPRSVLLGADVVSGAADRSMVFRVVRSMCLMRNEFYLAAALSKTTLVPLVQACISLYTGGPPDAWKNETVDGWMRAFGDEPPELLQTLGEAVAEYVATGVPLNLDAWPRAVELTAHRVALLLCGDLPRAAKGANDVARPISDLDVRERVLDMVRFAAGEDYASLRGELGLGVGQQ